MGEFDELRQQIQQDYEDMMLGFSVQRDTIRRLENSFSKSVRRQGRILTSLHRHMNAFLDLHVNLESRVTALERRFTT